jgi:ketosteroid isomerase-like protein
MFVAMWFAMMIAMMLHSTWPMLRFYHRGVIFREEPAATWLPWIVALVARVVGVGSIIAGALMMASVVSGATAPVSAQTQARISAELQALVDTERAFAHTATIKGQRDSFLEFFADDAIALTPLPTSAKDRLRSRPSEPFSTNELTWEPRTGDIAGSGEIGWLTGPSSYHAAGETRLQYGNYLSVWRRQADGTWRVFIDVGVGTPQPVRFAPGFTRSAFGRRYTGKDGRAAAARALLESDRELNVRIASDGVGKAYGARLAESARLQRDGTMSIVGRKAITAWLGQNAAAMSATSGSADASESGDLGYSYGTYEMKGTAPQSGAYLRVWTRDAAGTWLVVADVTQPIT